MLLNPITSPYSTQNLATCWGRSRSPYPRKPYYSGHYWMTAKTSRLNLSEFMTTVIPSHGQVKLLAAVKIYPQKARVVFYCFFCYYWTSQPDKSTKCAWNTRPLSNTKVQWRMTKILPHSSLSSKPVPKRRSIFTIKNLRPNRLFNAWIRTFWTCADIVYMNHLSFETCEKLITKLAPPMT